MLELLALAIAPTLFILLYIYRKDRYEPEPLHLIAWVFFIGAFSVIPAALVELLFPEGIFSSAVVAPVVEEAAKFLVVFLAIYRHPGFDEPMDGIVYATAAGLGFATVENILYVIEGGLAVGIIRAIASVPGHVVFSCIWGFALGTAKFRPDNERTGIILTGLLSAMLLHGIFNFSLEVFGAFGLVLILVVIIPLGWRMTCRNIGCAHADPASACSAKNRPASLSVPAGTTPAGMSPVPSQHPLSPSEPSLSFGIMADSSPRSAGDGMHRFCTNCGAENKAGKRFCGNCGKEF
ncbi:MAG: PrsW family glutamic-type intramembrane protease [Methanoregula sp.]|nr:PrsW family glutamic-type intramembrane protease [Methanoregula sp.]